MLPTKPMGSPDAARRAFVLSGETRVHDIADACREAGVLFLAGSGGHWGRLELATWLTGPYASATRVDSRRALSPRRRPGVHHQRLTEASVESLLFRARERVIAMLEGASDAWATAAFARDMIAQGSSSACKMRTAPSATRRSTPARCACSTASPRCSSPTT
jgi:hypothetical protein